jgi:outer membrane protein
MKKMIIALVAVVMSVGVASAQNYMVVDSEKIFKSVASYNEALEDIEKLATQYQQAVDDKFAEVESLYNSYMQQRSSLTVSSQQQYEQLILKREAEATEYQESLFGTEGELMKKRVALIQPIQQRVFNIIESFSKQYGYDLVIDIAANPTILYYSSKVDFTARIIDALK